MLDSVKRVAKIPPKKAFVYQKVVLLKALFPKFCFQNAFLGVVNCPFLCSSPEPILLHHVELIYTTADKYSRTSMARTPMAHLPRLFQTLS